VNVTRDFGLSGGDEIGVDDATFRDAETLATARADRKVYVLGSRAAIHEDEECCCPV
jgi:hypothetical protein